MDTALTTTTKPAADIIITTTTTTNTTTTSNTAKTPTTSALLNESRQLLLKQQLKLKLNINVSEMMDNIRRNVDGKQQSSYNIIGNNGHDGKRDHQKDHDILGDQADVDLESHKANGSGRGYNKLDTVTTVPQLQQKINKFNIIDEAAITTNTKATASTKACLAAVKTSTTTASSSSSTSVKTSLTQEQQQNTALAKFNRIIDNTVPVINSYNYQQTVAKTLCKSSQQQHPPCQHEQHQRQQQQQQQKSVEMPILSDSLKRRLTNNNHQYYYNTDLIVNNSKVNFSSSTTTTTTAAKTSKQAAAAASTSKAAAAAALAMLEAASSSSQQEHKSETTTKMSLNEDEQSERNDVHYLLKHLNSFSDIEEIEIVDMKQKQRLLQKQQEQYQQEQQNLQKYNKSKNDIIANNQQQPQQQCNAEKCEQQHEEKMASLNFTEYQHVEHLKHQYVDYVVDTTKLQPQHVSTDQLYVVATSEQVPSAQTLLSDHHVVDSQQQVVVGMQTYAMESKQHYYQSSATTSPTATSLVIYSPSSQSHKGIRRYASQEEHHSTASYHPHLYHHPHHHHQHYVHHQPYNHYVQLPLDHYSEGSMLKSASAQAAAADPLILQQFVDDYIFQSCHYLEANNFVANYRTAMVESSSHEFRPSTTTTTRTSNEEFYEEEEAGYIEDHSSAHSFELHETEPPTVICKAPAPLIDSKRSISSMQQQTHYQKQEPYTMETRLCSSGVQTDLTASSLAQSFSLSSSLSSSEKRKHRQPLFKCCYTPLDRWREKRSLQQRTKSANTSAAAAIATNTLQKSNEQQLQLLQITTKNTSVAVVGDPSNAGCSSAFLSSTIATPTTITTTMSTSNYQQHHNKSLTKNNNKNNAPYAV